MNPDKIFITGFSKGLGRELTKSFSPKKVIGIARTEFTDLGCANIIANISNYEYVKELLRYKGVIPKGRKIAAVLCAGTLGEGGGLLSSNLKDWDKIIKTNLLGNLAVLQSLLPHMIETGYGRVVFISGGGAANSFPLFSGYSLSKVAIVREVENIAEELKGEIDDFSIIALAPGAMETDMLKKVRQAGAEIRTVVPVKETVEFINKFLSMNSKKAKELSGKFIHVRDNLDSEPFENKWLLRRIEK